MKRVLLLLAAAVCAVSTGFSASLDDRFAGTTLGDRWAWMCEDSCRGYVQDGLVLNPQTGFRQAAIGTTKSDYTWVMEAVPITYQFTIEAWNIATNTSVSARLFLVGNDAGDQPVAYSDYDKPNVLMAKLDRFQGSFFWNLYVKNRSPQLNADADSFKLAWMEVGTAVDGWTFGVTLKGTTARMWWTSRDGVRQAGDPVTVPSALFSDGATFYVGVKNDTGGPFGDDEVVRIYNVWIGPEMPKRR